MTNDERELRIHKAGILAMRDEAAKIRAEDDYKTRRCMGSYIPRRSEIRPECRDCLRYVATYAPQAEYIAAAMRNGQCANKVTSGDTEGMGL